MSSTPVETLNGFSMTKLPFVQRQSSDISSVKPACKTSKQQYKEFMQTKQALKDYNNSKTTKNFLAKRDRIIKNGWRHGVLGVESPENPDSDIYNEAYKAKVKMLNDKNVINSRRKTGMLVHI